MTSEQKMMTNRFDTPHGLPGKLIIVEGIDGSGKSTQIQLLQKWLTNSRFRTFFTEWNSSQLVNDTIKRGKKKNLLTPTTFSILHAADFADRLAHLIIPPLKAGMIVLADRYVYTAFSRDVVRGVHPSWVRNMYGFSVKPDLAFYFKVPIETSLKRILVGRTALKFHEAGMDLGLSDDPKESFKLFQSQILTQYDSVAQEYGMIVIDATQSIKKQQALVRDIVREELKGYNGIAYLGKKHRAHGT